MMPVRFSHSGRRMAHRVRKESRAQSGIVWSRVGL